MEKVIVVGGGHAAAQFCASMAERGQGHTVCMITEEAHLPYQKPPLSKSWGQVAAIKPTLIRAESFYQKHGIEVLLSTRVDSFDAHNQTVNFGSGLSRKFSSLILATGLRPRHLPVFEGETFENVHSLRSLDDAIQIFDQVKNADNVVIVGGGFIGLE